jgi:hypothetical protein
MSPSHRRYLLLEQGIGAALFNFVLNGAIAWLMFRTLEEVPLWGRQSIAGDTIGTSLLLPLITCLVVTPLARRQVEAGRLAPLSWTRVSHAALGWLPRATLGRAVVLGLVCMAVLAPPTLLVLGLLHVTHLGTWQFIAFKASFAAGEALLVTPVIARWAIAESAVVFH